MCFYLTWWIKVLADVDYKLSKHGYVPMMSKKKKVLWNPLHLSQNISHFSTENDFLSMLFAVLSTWNSRTNQMGRRPIWLPNKILAASIANKVKSQKSLGFFMMLFSFYFLSFSFIYLLLCFCWLHVTFNFTVAFF